MVNLWLLRLVSNVSHFKLFNIAVTLAFLSFVPVTCKPSSTSLDLFQFISILCSMRGPSSGSIFHRWACKCGVTCSLNLKQSASSQFYSYTVFYRVGSVPGRWRLRGVGLLSVMPVWHHHDIGHCTGPHASLRCYLWYPNLRFPFPSQSKIPGNFTAVCNQHCHKAVDDGLAVAMPFFWGK